MNINGIEIYVDQNYVKDSKGVVIISHGLAEHCGRYDFITKKLNEANYDVIRYDQRGHGRSKGKRGKLKSFHDFIDDLHVLVLGEKKKNKKIFILGHSMGGSVVNLYAAKYGDIDGVISSGAATDTPKEAKFMKYLGFWWLRWMPKKTSFGDTLCRDESVVKAYIEDPYVLPKFYVSLAGEMFISGVRFLRKNISNITMPILYLHGAEDEIVNPKFSRTMYEKVPATIKSIIIYENNRHEIFNDFDKEKVIGDIIYWLDSLLKNE